MSERIDWISCFFNNLCSKQDSSYDSDHENLTAGAFLGAATNIGGGGGGGGGSLDLIPAPSVGVGGGGGGGGGGLAPLTIPAPGSGVMSRSHNDVSRCEQQRKIQLLFQ